MWGPRIQGRSVLLRPVAEAEIPTFLDWFADPDVIRYLGMPFHAQTPASERQWWEGAGSDPDGVSWGMEFEGRIVGTTSINRIDWVSRNAMTGTVIGDRSAWGKGIATEAMRLRAAYAFQHLQLHKLNSGYYEPNEGSARAQASCGYRVIGRSRDGLYRDGQWHDMVVTELMRADWEAAH
ncbi:MAG: GNAT family N-acetyltransferase [Candidatus Dormibacteraeota bacterium]|nr:GNAT family N-acetyltransferase [Candidatus Dormibacteraeota bacterium]